MSNRRTNNSNRSNIFECVGLVILIISLIGVFPVMNWKPEAAEAKPDKITINQNVDRELLGKLPTSNNNENNENNENSENSEEVAYGGYSYSTVGNYYYAGGIGGVGTYTNATPNAHTEQNTAANQIVVEMQAQEEATEEKVTEAKTTVAEKVLQIVYLDEFGKETTEAIVEQDSVIVTDDGTFGIVTTPIQDNQNQGDISGEDKREVIEMEVFFGDEDFTTQDMSADGQNVAQ